MYGARKNLISLDDISSGIPRLSGSNLNIRRVIEKKTFLNGPLQAFNGYCFFPCYLVSEGIKITAKVQVFHNILFG